MKKLIVIGVMPTITLQNAQEIREIIEADCPDHVVRVLPGVLTFQELQVAEYVSTVKAPQSGEYV